jgi:hypothetical protein
VVGVENTCRVMAFDWDTPFNVYENVPVLASVKVKVAVPTSVLVTNALFQGFALKAGPVVRKSAPV